MMGIKQQLRGGCENDLIYAKRLYCYLQNHSPSKKIKIQMRRRRRRNMKKELDSLEN